MKGLDLQVADALATVDVLRRTRFAAERDYVAAVRLASRLGASVVEIASAAGVSRQRIYQILDEKNGEQ